MLVKNQDNFKGNKHFYTDMNIFIEISNTMQIYADHETFEFFFIRNEEHVQCFYRILVLNHESCSLIDSAIHYVFCCREWVA